MTLIIITRKWYVYTFEVTPCYERPIVTSWIKTCMACLTECLPISFLYFRWCWFYSINGRNLKTFGICLLIESRESTSTVTINYLLNQLWHDCLCYFYPCKQRKRIAFLSLLIPRKYPKKRKILQFKKGLYSWYFLCYNYTVKGLY